jgi:hypothetical protein
VLCKQRAPMTTLKFTTAMTKKNQQDVNPNLRKTKCQDGFGEQNRKSDCHDDNVQEGVLLLGFCAPITKTFHEGILQTAVIVIRPSIDRQLLTNKSLCHGIFTVYVYLPKRARSYAIDGLLECEQMRYHVNVTQPRHATILRHVKEGGGGKAPRYGSIERLINERVVTTNVNKRVLQKGSLVNINPRT